MPFTPSQEIKRNIEQAEKQLRKLDAKIEIARAGGRTGEVQAFLLLQSKLKEALEKYKALMRKRQQIFGGD